MLSLLDTLTRDPRKTREISAHKDNTFYYRDHFHRKTRKGHAISYAYAIHFPRDFTLSIKGNYTLAFIRQYF